MANLNFFSKCYPAKKEPGRGLHDVENYLTRQNHELYIYLRRLDQKLTQLEARISKLEPAPVSIVTDE